MVADRHWTPAGAFLFTAGATIGPSAGQFYAGSGGAALGSAGLRILGGGLFIYGTAIQCLGCRAVDAITSQDHTQPDENYKDKEGALLVPLGLAIYGLGALVSVIDTHFAVRRNHEEVTGRRAELAPLLLPSSDGRLASGALVRLRF